MYLVIFSLSKKTSRGRTRVDQSPQRVSLFFRPKVALFPLLVDRR